MSFNRLITEKKVNHKINKMKKAGIITLMVLFLMQGFSQETKSVENPENRGNIYQENTNIIIGDTLLGIQDDGESVRIRIGNRRLEILEALEGKPQIRFENYNQYRQNDDIYNFPHSRDRDEIKKKRYRRFKGHWSGIELGFNNYMTSERNLVMPDEIDYMTLHSGKSMGFNLNFTQQSFGFTGFLGLITGLGLNWNNYHFDGNNNIVKNSDGVITMLDPAGTLKKSKFTTLYLTLPVLLEVQIPTDSKKINLAGGVIGAIKLASHNKMVYQNGDKVKSDDDFSLNMLRYGFTARAGFENFQLFGTYYPVSLFRQGKGPGGYSLYPFEIGLAFTFND